MIQPKVSIIIPAYNVEDYFENCLLSMINQKLLEIEIIVVVDGAIDNTLAIANKYNDIDKRIKVYNTENNGPAIARNIGLLNSSGKYIVFIDADDWILEESLYELYNCAEENNADIVCFGYRRIFMDGTSKDETFNKTIINKEKKLENYVSQEILGFFLSNYGHGISNKFIKKDILINNKISFESDNQTQAEDLYVSYQLLFNNPKVYILNKPFYNYVQHENSSLHLSPKKIGERYLQLFERIYQKIPNDEYQNENVKILAWLSFYMTTFIYTNWKYNKMKWFKEEVKCYKTNVFYLKLMNICLKITRINNEDRNVFLLRKLYCFFYAYKLPYIADLLMIFRLVCFPKIKNMFK
jgi:glycosyltransferase involved in cell wall biosynthesis